MTQKIRSKQLTALWERLTAVMKSLNYLWNFSVTSWWKTFLSVSLAIPPFTNNSWICRFPIPVSITADGLLTASLSKVSGCCVRGPAPSCLPQVLFISPVSPWLCSILLILLVLANGRESEQIVQQRPCALLFSVLLRYCLSECSCFPFSKPLWAPLSPSRWPFLREDAGCSHWRYSLLWRKAQPRCLY